MAWRRARLQLCGFGGRQEGDESEKRPSALSRLEPELIQAAGSRGKRRASPLVRCLGPALVTRRAPFGGRPDRAVRRHSELRREVKSAALSQRTFDPNFPAHHFDQPL